MNISPPSYRSIRSGHGMTLVEVMIAMTILTFSALALVHLTFQLRVSAEDNIHHSAAYAIAQGYLEEMCKLCYANEVEIANPTPPPATIWATNPSMGISSPPGVWDIANDYSNSPHKVTFYLQAPDGTTMALNNNTQLPTPFIVNLDQDGSGNASFPMSFTFKPILQPLAADGKVNSPTVQGVQITIQFTYTYKLYGSNHYSRSFTSAVSTVYPNLPQ